MAVDTRLMERSLALPRNEREELARRLLISIETEDSGEDAEAIWVGEMRRRLDDLHGGKVTPLEWREAVERVRRGLKRRKTA